MQQKNTKLGFCKSFNIGNRTIDHEHPPCIVAEISANHQGDLVHARELIDAAADCGVSAVKLQTYRADTITLDSNRPEFQITEGRNAGMTLFELYDRAHTPWEWHEELIARANSRGLEAFSSPFDFSAIDFLERLNVPAYKIASFELVDIPLIKKACATGKPVILSTGTAGLAKIKEALNACLSTGNKKIILLHCVSGYPTPIQETNLKTITRLADQFDCLVGLSDHTLTIESCLGSIALGAVFIEKHFTLRRADGGFDAAFSLEPEEMRQLVESASKIWSALGSDNFDLKPSEVYTSRLNRSLYVVKKVKKGEQITKECIRSVRPNNGLPPKHYDQVIGKTAVEDIEANTPLSWSMFE